VGLEYLRELERYLRDALEISLHDAANATAGPLQDRRDLFSEYTQGEPRSLYVHSLNLPVQLDGYTDDWSAYLDWSDVYSNDEVAFRLLTSSDEQYYYALLQVNDSSIKYQEYASPGNLLNDHIQMIITDRRGQPISYYISPTAPGPVRPFTYQQQVNEFGFNNKEIEYANNIDSVWQPTDTGYNLEIAIPRYMATDRLGFIVHDVDVESSGTSTASHGTAGKQTSQRPGRLLEASLTITQIINRIGSMSGRRIWVLNSRGEVLATVGNLTSNVDTSNENFLYGLILPSVHNRFTDDLTGASRLQGDEILNALQGESANRWRTSPDGRAVIISSAIPVYVDETIRGVVMVEESTNSIQMLQRKAMASLFNKTVFVFSLVTLLLLAFATRLSIRLRNLSHEAESAIDEHGRVINVFSSDSARDEIGDLSRNYSAMLERLKQYNDYMEAMSGRLSHELRTPITVVQSSLDHINTGEDPVDQSVYIERAREGVERLNLIVTRLSEATRIEHILQNAEKIETDISSLFSNCIEGYKSAFPEQKFERWINLWAMQWIYQ
jgi:signal transduction histidine kinase